MSHTGFRGDGDLTPIPWSRGQISDSTEPGVLRSLYKTQDGSERWELENPSRTRGTTCCLESRQSSRQEASKSNAACIETQRTSRDKRGLGDVIDSRGADLQFLRD